MRSPVISQIVENSMCIGCGMCGAMCPDHVLKMSWNLRGEYNPVEEKDCTKDCGICLKVCPFFDSNETEDDIVERLFGNVDKVFRNPLTGFYLGSYVGFSDEHRATSASGGITTWLLENLLTEEVVDRVICVSPTEEPDKLFNFQVFDTVEGLRSGAGSAYYPVEMSEVIRIIIAEPGRYAITGVPCFIKAIRLAQRTNAKLRERIVITVGLVCGQMKSKHFTDYIASIAGVEGEVTRVIYRGKDRDRPVSDYHYKFTTSSGEERRIYWSEGISQAWLNRWFTPRACNYCDDIFAECADVTCMDAWLPELSNDRSGTSLVIVRSPLVLDKISKGRNAHLSPISITKVIQSQAAGVSTKRQDLAYRLYLDGRSRKKIPRKRAIPVKLRNPLIRSQLEIMNKMQVTSGDAWVASPEKEAFQSAMHPYLRKQAVIILTARGLMWPLRVFRFRKRREEGRPQ